MNKKPKLAAILQALLVTFLWSTSWVLIKFGLDDIPALTFAGMRYVLAFLFLLPFFFRSGQAAQLKTLTRKDWLTLAGLGLVGGTRGSGASQFCGRLAGSSLPADGAARRHLRR